MDANGTTFFTPRIYKYFGEKKHLNSFLEDGEVYFNSLSFFISCEDKSRRDNEEGTCIYRPTGGLLVTNLTTQKTFTLPGQFNSKIKSPDRIFVFCVSNDLSKDLYQKFRAQGCIEILDAEEFKRRLQSQITEAHRQGKLGSDQLMAGPVSYFPLNEEPGTRHACPDQIVMAKSEDYKDEKEFRFAFSLDAGAFDVNNVEYSLSPSSVPTNSGLASQTFRLGSLVDICKVVSP